ncbi:MAG: EamA family transporter [Niabella sp.]
MASKKPESLLLIVLAFAAVYIIWGSTYFFIERAVRYFPPMVIGALRFWAAGIILMIWAAWRREKLWNKKAMLYSLISGILMLFVGNGAVIWAEQYLQSSFVAIFLASSPIWFLVLDKPQWQKNFSSQLTLVGVFAGLVGVVLLFYEKLTAGSLAVSLLPLLVITLGNVGWTMGSLVSKYKVKNISPTVNSAWQMLAAATAFTIVGVSNHSFANTQWQAVPPEGWFSMVYLIVFGSIIGFSAYVYLLAHRNPTQVSSYAYVNPLVAVLLGVWLNQEKISLLQLAGLAVILLSVVFINIAKQRIRHKKAAIYSAAKRS